MRCIFSIAAIFSVLSISAQDYSSPATVNIGRELPRSKVIACPTLAEAKAESDEASKYMQPLDEWVCRTNGDDTVFSSDFTVPFAWANRQVLLHIESASSAYEIRINGKVAGYNQNGTVPAEYNITKSTDEGKNNIEITLFGNPVSSVLESYPHDKTPALGRTYVMTQPTIRIRDIAVRTTDNGDAVMSEIAIAVKSDALNPKSARIYYELIAPDSATMKQGFYDISLDMRREDTLRILAEVPRTALWSTDNPNLCMLYLKTQTEGRYTEYMSFRVGFRTVTNENGKLMVNGKPTTLYVADLPKELTGARMLELKQSGYNTIKLPAGIVPRKIYSLCDLMGMYIIEQAAVNTSNSGRSIRKGGNPSNDPSWRRAYGERATESYHTSKLHPAVIAFALADKSANGICLYESYMKMKNMEHDRPIIYMDAGGQWNSDKLDIKQHSK